LNEFKLSISVVESVDHENERKIQDMFSLVQEHPQETFLVSCVYENSRCGTVYEAIGIVTYMPATFLFFNFVLILVMNQ